MWVTAKFRLKLWVFVFVYVPSSEWDKEEMERFFCNIVDCLLTFTANVNVGLLWDQNARPCIVMVEGLIDMHGVPGRNDNKKNMNRVKCQARV